MICGLLLVTFWYGQRSVFTNVRTKIRRAFLDSEDYYGTDHGDFNTTQYAECHSAYEGVTIREVLLKGVDGEQGEIGLLLCISEEIDVD